MRSLQLVVCAACLFLLPAQAHAAVCNADDPAGQTDPATRVPAGRPAALIPLYVSFTTLQVLDAHTTLSAIDRGAQEVNPLLGGVAGSPARLVAVKAGLVAGTIFMSERLWKQNRLGAILGMIALNSAYAIIVWHNYDVRSHPAGQRNDQRGTR